MGANKTAAKQALAKRQTEILEGRFFPRRKGTAMLFADFAAYYWRLHGRYKRAHSYRYMLRQLAARFGKHPLDRITVPMVLEYRNLVRDRAGPSTANRHHSFLRSMLNKAIEWGKLSGANPAAKLKQEREPNHRLRFLSEEEVARLLYVCHARIFPVVACALLTGMRKGEILALDWEHIDLERGIIYVLQSKSGKAREIPVSPKLDRVLRDLGPAGKGSVFEVPEITLRRAFARALRDARIENFRFHDLRHTFASHYGDEDRGSARLAEAFGA